MGKEFDSQKPSVMKPWLKYYNKDDITEEVPESTLYDYIFRKNKERLNEIAMEYFGNNITYKELFENIRKTACAYAALGIREGDIVTICSVTTPEFVYSFYAMSLIGAVINMVDPRTSVEGIRGYINETESKYLCVLNEVYPKVCEAAAGTGLVGIIIISPADSMTYISRRAYYLKKRDNNNYSSICVKWKHFISNGKDIVLEPVSYSRERCAVIVHTGGTTGSPKGVMLSDAAFNAVAFQYDKSNIKFRPKQKFLNVMPPYIAYGLACGIHMPLALGLKTIIIPNLNPDELANLVLRYKPEHMCGVPVHYQLLMKDKRMGQADISFLISSGAGGDGIPVGTEIEVDKFLKAHGSRYPLAKGYGMTELCSSTCSCMRDINKPGSVGIPLLKNTISAYEPGTDTELDFYKKGEICITGPTIMLGYYGKPEETANVLRRHSDGKLWVHTGDIGYVDEDGFVFIENRIKRMIIRHDGFKVFPGMIENVISTHPDVETCSVVSFRDKNQPQGHMPYAHIVLKEDAGKSQEQIKAEIVEICRRKLPEYMLPAEYAFCKSLYYTPMGKVDYRKMEKKLV